MTVCYNSYFIVILDITTILKETPDKDELLQLLYDISDKWYDIGLSLQVPRNVLNDLRQSEGHNIVKLNKVLNIWNDTKSSTVTWQTVITAMESSVINDKGIANKIHQDLKLSKLLLLSNEVVLLILSLSISFNV